MTTPVWLAAVIIAFAAGLAVGMYFCNRRVVDAARDGVYLTWRQAARVRRAAAVVTEAVERPER